MSKPMSNRLTKRTKKDSTLVAVWVPTDLLKKLDSLAAMEDLDRSKFIRRAIRSKIGNVA